MKYRLSEHAKRQLKRRDIPDNILDSVIQNPQQIVPEDRGRKAFQSVVDFRGKMFLVRAIVEEKTDSIFVITAYRTTKIRKYWREESDESDI